MDNVKSKRFPDAANPAAKLLPPTGAVGSLISIRLPPAANDEWAWNLVPFPDGWYATC